MRSALNAANMRFDSEIGVEMRIGIIGEKGDAQRLPPPPQVKGERETAPRDQRDRKDQGTTFALCVSFVSLVSFVP